MSQVGVFPASFPDDSLVPIPSNDVNIYPELGQVTPRVRTQVDPDEAVVLAREWEDHPGVVLKNLS